MLLDLDLILRYVNYQRMSELDIKKFHLKNQLKDT